MEFKTFLRRELLPSFFISVTCISFAMAVIGTVFEPEARFGYEVLFSPFIYGLIAALIQMVSYTKKELTAKQAIIRTILHILLLEAGIMSILYSLKALKGPGITLTLALSIPAIYAAVSLIMWLSDRRTAEAVNKALKELQKQNPS